ncbi:hypothetical protein BC833DRAFT_610833 [Globomyces pollinis-pini]|nr:hypothetical protein BC833DRAFT_610833 [Globomyces pollinis-pini]
MKSVETKDQGLFYQTERASGFNVDNQKNQEGGLLLEALGGGRRPSGINQPRTPPTKVQRKLRGNSRERTTQFGSPVGLTDDGKIYFLILGPPLLTLHNHHLQRQKTPTLDLKQNSIHENFNHSLNYSPTGHQGSQDKYSITIIGISNDTLPFVINLLQENCGQLLHYHSSPNQRANWRVFAFQSADAVSLALKLDGRMFEDILLHVQPGHTVLNSNSYNTTVINTGITSNNNAQTFQPVPNMNQNSFTNNTQNNQMNYSNPTHSRLKLTDQALITPMKPSKQTLLSSNQSPSLGHSQLSPPFLSPDQHHSPTPLQLSSNRSSLPFKSTDGALGLDSNYVQPVLQQSSKTTLSQPLENKNQTIVNPMTNGFLESVSMQPVNASLVGEGEPCIQRKDGLIDRVYDYIFGW